MDKQIEALIAKTDALIAEADKSIRESRNERRRNKRNNISFCSYEGILNAFDCGVPLEELYIEYSQYTQKAIRAVVEDYQNALAASKKGGN